MSLMDKIEECAESLRRVRTAIVDRGGSVAADAGLSALPEAISNIPATVSVKFYTERAVAYESPVPPTTHEYALVAELGGLCRPSSNLFGASLEAGSIDDEGNNEASSFRVRSKEATPLPVGTYTISFTAAEGASYAVCLRCYDLNGAFVPAEDDFSSAYNARTFTLAEPRLVRFVFRRTDGAAFAPEALGVMLARGSEPALFEPRFPELRPVRVTSLECRGMNFLPTPPERSVTVRGISFVRNRDGSYTLNGKNNGLGHSQFHLAANYGTRDLPRGRYRLEGMGAAQSAYLVVYNGTRYAHLNASAPDYVAEDGETVKYILEVARGDATVFENVTVKPRLVTGETVDTLAIPEAVRSLEGYGFGISASLCNRLVVTPDAVRYSRRVVRCTEKSLAPRCIAYSSVAFFAISKSANGLAPSRTSYILASGFETDARAAGALLDTSYMVGRVTGSAADDEYWFGFPTGTTLAEAQSVVDECDVYAASTNTETTDVTELFPSKYVRVFPDCVVTAHNADAEPVPLALKYVID